jgi:hypothetical protein
LKKSAKKESHILVISLLGVIAVAIIGLNLDNLTGNASFSTFNSRTSVSLPLNDKFVNAGEYINIKVNPGPKCVNRIVGIYDENDRRKATAQPSSGEFGSNKKMCSPFTIRFKTYPNWKSTADETGIHFVKVFDYETEDFISTTFTIN